MATGGENTFSCCSPCFDDGRNTVARHYCVDCEMYFCTKCVKSHTTIPVLRNHQVNDVNVTYSSDIQDKESPTTGSASVDDISCTLHIGIPIDTYCKDHDKVFCGTCAVVKHRSCTTLSIADAARDFKSSPDMKRFKEALTENLAQCKQEKEKRKNNLDSIDQQKLELIENVDTYEEKIIAKIKELASISRKEIRSKYEEHKTVIDSDIKALDVVMATAEGFVDKLEHTEDEHLFITVKTSKKVLKDGEMLLQTLTKNHKEREIQFYLDETLETRVLGMKSLGRLDIEYRENSVVKEYEAKYHASLSIEQTAESIAQIFDMCLMDTNDIMLTDYQNKKLKRYGSNLQLNDAILLSGHPVAVCKIDKHEVAVRIQSIRGSRAVNIVSVGKTMQVTSSLKLASVGWGMTYDAGTGEILACEGNKVSVYSKTGNKLRTYDKDRNGESMFSSCRQIALSENKQDVYVSDIHTGVIVFDKSGTLKRKVSLSGCFSNIWPLCLLPGNICLTGNYTSALVGQLDHTGKQVGNLIDIKDGRTCTYCAVYDREHSRLFVGGNQSMMSVYTLKAK